MNVFFTSRAAARSYAADVHVVVQHPSDIRLTFEFVGRSPEAVYFSNQRMFPAELATDIWLFLSPNISQNSETFESVEAFFVMCLAYCINLAHLCYTVVDLQKYLLFMACLHWQKFWTMAGEAVDWRGSPSSSQV